MPSFVLVDTSGESRIIVRGEIAVTIDDADGARVIDAATVSTWVEQLVPGLRSVTVAVPGAVDAIARDLPFDGGVALVSSLRAAVIADEIVADDAVADQTVADEIVADAIVLPDATPAVVAAAVVDVDGPPAPPSAADRIDAPPPISDLEPVEHEVDPHATVIGPFDTAPPAAPAVEGQDAVAVSTSTPNAEPAADADADADGYDYLFGETVYRSVAEAAVPEAATDESPEAAAESATTAELAGDHDGETVLTSDIAKLRGDRQRLTPDEMAPVITVVPSVILPNGSRERLDQPIIIGRSPSASQVTAGSIPKLITLGSGDQDISRSHVRLALEGGTVVVTDLHSVNGTSVLLPGREPQRLRAGDSTAVIPGTIVDLGGGVTLTVVED